jgi:ABC-type uncharacterized transport system involved in gliding motility auxiliary subunit
MLAGYGVTVMPEIAMDRSALTMQYQTRTPTGAIQIRITRNPQWIRILGENGNPAHPVSAQFGGLDMYWASPLELHEGEGIEADYLFTSTADAWSMGEPFSTNPDVSYLFERDAHRTRGTKILGVSLSGIFPSWWGDRPAPEPYDGFTFSDMPEEAKPSRIIVIGETEFATTFINITGGQRNMDFLVYAADWLSNDDDIIGIRSRVSGSSRLDRIIDPQQKAAAMRFAQITNVLLVPLLVIITGILLALRRRARTLSAKTHSRAETKEDEKEL